MLAEITSGMDEPVLPRDMRELEAMRRSDLRLARVLASWVEAEVGQWYRRFESRAAYVELETAGDIQQFKHTSFGCDGEKMEGAPSKSRPTLEGAARALVDRLTRDRAFCGVTPETHVIVWRDKPEFDLIGVYERRAVAYTRLCYVRVPEGAKLFDGSASQPIERFI